MSLQKNVDMSYQKMIDISVTRIFELSARLIKGSESYYHVMLSSFNVNKEMFIRLRRMGHMESPELVINEKRARLLRLIYSGLAWEEIHEELTKKDGSRRIV